MTPITAAATIQRIADSGLDISTEDYRALVEVAQWLATLQEPVSTELDDIIDTLDETIDEIVDTILDDNNVDTLNDEERVSPETWLSAKTEILALLAQRKEKAQ
jgi:hypothetical protein